MRSTSWWSGLLGGALLLGCGDDGSMPGGGQMLTTRSSVSDGYGALGDIAVAPGPGVSGLYPGDGPNNLEDGWHVDYQKLLVTIGSVTLRDTSEGDLEFAGNVVVDLQALPITGARLGAVDIRSGPSAVEFTVPRAAGDAYAPLSPYASEADAALMAKGGYAVYIEGTIEKDDGRSCLPGTADCVARPQIRFRWGIPAGTAYLDCVWDDPATASQAVTLTFPALHWLRASFDPDDASDLLLAQWIANADLDRDGETTLAELEQIDAALLFTRRRGYDLSGAAAPVATAADFLREQVRAMGLRAWGRCAAAQPL